MLLSFSHLDPWKELANASRARNEDAESYGSYDEDVHHELMESFPQLREGGRSELISA